MRNRLIELLRKADDVTEVNACDYPTYEKAMQAFYTSIADCLLVNGVIVPPCAVGDTVWMVIDNRDFKRRMKDYCLSAEELPDLNIAEHNFNLLLLSSIGKTVFLTKEEAEAKLEELKGE